MEQATIDGAALAYDIAGSGEPVVCIYGAFIADSFRPLLTEPSLTGRYRLIRYHRRGYAGSSPATEPASIHRQAADCRSLLDYLGVDRAHVVGHSYGGAIALQLALDAPGVVHSLAVLEPALLVGASAEGYRAALVRSSERYRQAGAATVVDEFLEARSPGYRAALDRVLPGGFAQAVRDAGTWFDWELPGLLGWRFGEAEARRISQPVLAVLGGQSNVLWPRFGETHRLLLAWLPQAEGYILPGATHLMQLEHPPAKATAVAEELAAFWTRHRLAPAVRSAARRLDGRYSGQKKGHGG